MSRLLLFLLSSIALALLGPAFAACSDTPRGVQEIIPGIPEGGALDAPTLRDVGPDAHGPCSESTDSTGVCANVSVSGVSYSHLIVCTGAEGPALLVCLASGSTAPTGEESYCCTTGIL
jgi:hypothetical protein